jgi:hypothetical protein
MVLTHGSVAEEVDTDTVRLFGFILKDCMDNVSHTFFGNCEAHLFLAIQNLNDALGRGEFRLWSH